MILDLFYISLIVFAIIAIQTTVLRNAIIYLSVFSLICSIVYLFLGAPDVAIAEAAIGCTLSTILYLVALKKYQIFTVYYSLLSKDFDELVQLKQEKEIIRDAVTNFAEDCELQLDIINTSSSFKQLKSSVSFDVTIFHSNRGIWLHGLKNNYHYNELTYYLERALSLPIHVYFMHEDEDATIGSE